MPTSQIDLKLRLTLRVAAIAALCGAAAAAYVLFESGREARTRVDWMAEVAASDLVLQQHKMRWITGAPFRFPDLQEIAEALATPGLCIAYRAADGATVQRLCDGVAPSELGAPQPFARLYRLLFDPERESSRPVTVRGGTGAAVASIDPRVLIAQSWRDTSRVLAVMAAVLVGLCVLTYAALARALRPTRTIRAGLARLAAGDLSARLPAFNLAELSAVADVFNDLAASLETTTGERDALTRRLISVQDDERQHLARELHDEFGQCLAAIAAIAAAARETAAQARSALEPECKRIGAITADMMQVLRGTLLRLRPPDIAELGLAASLEGLVAGWNRSCGGLTSFALDLSGDVDALPEEFAASLYRVVQEAVTNAAKHARASRVRVHLHLRGDELELLVEDDGTGGDGASMPGMGLLGMRERVAALGGSLALQASRPSGLILRARIPVPSLVPAAQVARTAA